MKYKFSRNIDQKYCKNILAKAQTLWSFDILLCGKIIGPASVYRMIYADKTNKKNSIFKNMLLDTLASSESIVPGSSAYFALDLPEHHYVETGRLSTTEILREVLAIPSSNLSKNIYKNVVEYMGPETKVVVKKSKKTKTIIEVTSGFKLPIGIDPIFYKNVSEKIINISDVEIVLIEGSPSSVGEINYILERSHNEKKNIVLICRSFSEEVIATLSTNWMRDSLRIVPATYGNDIDSVNLPVDMFAITGVLPITPKLGDSISVALTDNEKRGYAKSISISDYECIVTSHRSVYEHRKELISRMKSETDKEKQNILSNRISSLSNELITVLVPEKYNVITEEIDMLFKIHAQFCQSGYAKIDEKKIPTSILKCVTEQKKLFAKLLRSIGGVLIVDD